MEIVIVALAVLLGIAIGYAVRRPPTDIERVRVQYVDKPTVVEKIIERVRVEYVDKPFIVEKPTIQIRDVPVHTETIKEVLKLVDRPVAAGRGVVATPEALVEVVFMDANQRNVKETARLDARLRRPTMYRGAAKYMLATQDEAGRYIYRQVAH